MSMRLSIFDICIPFNTKPDFKYLGVFIDKQKEATARTMALYAATNRCCGAPNFQVQLCSENVRWIVFQIYIYSALFCLSCNEDITQSVKNAYRLALFNVI